MSKYPLHAACREGNVTEAESLLRATPKAASQHDEDARLPLHWAITAPPPSSLTLLELLSTQPKFDPDAEDGSGWTPLMIASSLPPSNQSQQEMISLLLSREADVDAKNNSKQTALFFASSKSNLDVVRQLLAAGASARVVDAARRTPLHRAAAVGSVPIIRALLEKGAGMNGQDAEGWTALHHAIAEGHGDAAIVLLEAGASSERVSSEGKVAMQLCRDKKIREAIVQACRREDIELAMEPQP